MYYTQDMQGKLTLYSDRDKACTASQKMGCTGWGSLVMTPSNPVYAPDREPPDSPGHGTSCSCRACHMKYHGGW